MIIFVIFLLICLAKILLFYYRKAFVKKKKSSLPSPIIYYVAKNSVGWYQIRFSQTSKSTLELIKKIRPHDVADLLVDPDTKTYLTWYQIYISPEKLAKIQAPISVGDSLTFSYLTFEDFDNIMPKLNLKNFKIKRSGKYLFGPWLQPRLKFLFCEIPRNIFDLFLLLNCTKFELTKSITDDNCDILYNVLKNMESVKSITFDWQENVTSFERVAEIKKKIKLEHFVLYDIPKIIFPIMLQNFLENNMMKKRGYSSFDFTLPFPENYKEDIYKIVKPDFKIDLKNNVG